jgi:hypothetical protein
MRLGIQNSLEIISGKFELAASDDIEGRWATSGNYTNQFKPDVIIHAGGEFELIDGSGAHHREAATIPAPEFITRPGHGRFMVGRDSKTRVPISSTSTA